MPYNKYKVSILPSFEKDLDLVVDYISGHLKNPMAALNLVHMIFEAIDRRSYHPLAFRPYIFGEMQETKYYHIRVKKYVIFYVVMDDVMEVRRLFYARQNIII